MNDYFPWLSTESIRFRAEGGSVSRMGLRHRATFCNKECGAFKAQISFLSRLLLATPAICGKSTSPNREEAQLTRLIIPKGRYLFCSLFGCEQPWLRGVNPGHSMWGVDDRSRRCWWWRSTAPVPGHLSLLTWQCWTAETLSPSRAKPREMSVRSATQ